MVEFVVSELNFYEKTIDWYQKNAVFYAERSNLNTKIDKEQLLDFSKFVIPKGRVLDAGCGSGRDTNLFKDLGFDVVGIDISGNLIKEAKSRYPEVNFEEEDILDLGFESETFDGVWAHASIVHFETKEQNFKAISELTRVLKKGGFLHLLVRGKKDEKTGSQRDSISGGGERFYYNFNEDELREMIESGGLQILESNRYRESEVDLNKRPGEGIEWILLIARK